MSAATLLVASLSTSAAIIEVSYEGVITSNYNYDYLTGTNNSNGNGAGYNINDVISGSLFIDTDAAPNDYYSQSNLGYYRSYYNGNQGFVTGFDHETALDHSSNVTAHDYVYIEDDYYSSRDYFYTYDQQTSNYNDNAGNYGYNNSYLSLGGYSYVEDFISGDSLIQSFSISDFSNFAHTWGQVYDYGYDYVNYTRTNQAYGYSNFSLTKLNYNAVDVPEPSTIAIFALGLVGLVARKRAVK